MKSYRAQTYRKPGQAIVFIAVLLLVIVAAVGLSVDTGNAFSAQRTNSAGSQSASLAGMGAYLQRQPDSQIGEAVRQALIANRVDNPVQIFTGQTPELLPNQTGYKAVYIDNAGKYLCDVASCGLGANGAAPAGVRYIHVWTTEPVETSFAKLVGRPVLNVKAEAYASQCLGVTGVYPLTFDMGYLQKAGPGGKPLRPGDIFTVDAGINTGNIGHLAWFKKIGNKGWGASDSETAWQAAGSLHEGFQEGSDQAADPDLQIQMNINGRLEYGDWMYAQQGSVASLSGALQWHVDNGTVVKLPLYSATNGAGGENKQYKFGALGMFRMIDFQLTQSGDGSWFKLQFLGVSTGDPCPVPGDPSRTYQTDVFGHVDRLPAWAQFGSDVDSVDVAVIFDTSGSMKCPFDRDCVSGVDPAPVGSRRGDYALDALRKFVHGHLAKNAQGYDNRVAIAAFGEGNTGYLVKDFARNWSDFEPILGPLSMGLNTSTTISNAGKVYPKSGGLTPSAAGLQQSVKLFSTLRERDNNQKKVRHVVLFITDGLANVRIDEKAVNGPESNPPCPPNAAALGLWYDSKIYKWKDKNGNIYEINSNPQLQSTCPSNAESPIGSAIIIAEDLRSRTDVSFFVVGLALQTYSVDELGLNRIAGDFSRVFDVRTAGGMASLVDRINTELYNECSPQTGARVSANGATVDLYNSITNAKINNAPVYADATGDFMFTDVPPGSYYIKIKDLGPNGGGIAYGTDPTKRFYTRMYVNNQLIPLEFNVPLNTDRIDLTGGATKRQVELMVGDINGNNVSVCP